MMEKMFFKMLWWPIPFLIILSGLLVPSCGFIGLLFNSSNDGDNTKFFDVQMSYNYSGGRTVSTISPMILLFIPLDENFEFTDDGFNKATYVPNFISTGIAIVPDLERGPYAVLGYIDELPIGSPDGQLNMNEVYAFFNMKDFVNSVPQPDYIMVDSSLETWTPHFELDDTFIMDGFVVISPKEGETVYGEGPGFIHVVGLQIEPSIRTIEVTIDTISQGTFPADQEVFLVNMSLYSDGLRTLDIIAYDELMSIVSFEQPPLNIPVNFNYVAP